MPESNATAEPWFREVPLRSLEPEQLGRLSADMKLSLSVEDMLAVRDIFSEAGREPTDVELETIAQTWSEHCKHRIFNAEIEHDTGAGVETIDGLFKTFVRAVTEQVTADKPGFVLSAFHDNAGFVRVDDRLAACLKVETHNHPSAIEPYAGANTGLGGVIRDILGAGKGARPVANLDVFCFGPPDTPLERIKARDVIHPLGVMRGVVRGVRDYGNRMGIPTTGGAIQFDDSYIYNPLVFCGTLGVLPVTDIAKEVREGHLIVAVGGRTGRDGLKGATFSSASLTTDSHEADQSAVQIGNPIEEKKVADFILAAREENLIEFVTDCGAGGFSSAAGEMLSGTGGVLDLDRAPLKEQGLLSWQVFLSESQERMVLAVEEESLERLQELADTFETELAVLGHADGSGVLKVMHRGHRVLELDNSKLHEAPRRRLKSRAPQPRRLAQPAPAIADPAAELRGLLGDFAIVSRAPVIREYDHEVQGNTVLKPLAGAAGDAPQDGSVIALDDSPRLLAMALALLPEWGKTDPERMGAGVIDECVRQLTACGANPDRLALLDNFCVGNPDDPDELGALVETCKGMAAAAIGYGAPFVSGKDSFYNYFETDEGPVSIPVTLLASGFGVVEEIDHVTGASLRRSDSLLFMIGRTAEELGGSVWARRHGFTGGVVPATDFEQNLAGYRRLHIAIREGWVLSAHDLSEGGLAVAAAEMAFSGVGGVHIDLDRIPMDNGVSAAGLLFGESTGRVLVEVAPEHAASLEAMGLVPVGRATAARRITLRHDGSNLLDQPLEELKETWRNGLRHYY